MAENEGNYANEPMILNIAYIYARISVFVCACVFIDKYVYV